MKYGMNIEVNKPDKIQKINNIILDRLRLTKSRKNSIAMQIIIIAGIASLDTPSQCL